MNHDALGLLIMIYDIDHNHGETKFGIVAVIESDIELYLGYQSPTKPCDDYMAFLKARVDTINAHDGLVGRHPRYFKETFTRIAEEQELSKGMICYMSPDDRKVLQMDVQEIACKEYLAILFVK